MAYEIGWLVENRVLLQVATGDLLHEDIQQLSNELKKLSETSSSPIHLIADARNLKSFPRSIHDNYDVYKHLKSQNFGWVLHVSSDELLKYVSSTVSHLIGLKIRNFADVATAIEFLKQADPSIEWDEEIINY